MARQSKWPNEELWQQAVQWRKGGLTYSDISGQLARPDNSKRFGLKEGPSEDTVRREVKRRLSTQAPPPDKKLPDYSSLSDAQIGRHHEVLRAVLDNLQGIDVFSPHSSEIETWWSRPNEPSWPVAKGRVYRDKDDNLSVRLPAEDQLEWEYLQQHLVGDPVWPAVENWKLAMAKDISDRLCLLKTISERITRPTEQGGLGLPISAELGFVPVTQPEVTTYYVFTIYVQLMSRSLGLRHMPKTQ